MGRKIQIVPSILSADYGRLAEQVAAVSAAGADAIHVDVMDGHFVPNLTIGPVVLEAIRRATSVPLDVHLMIEQPERWVERYAAAGADWLHIHAEACVHLHRVVQQIRAAGVRPSVAINPATPIEALDYVLEDVDKVLVMTVNPGFGGQALIAGVLRKIDALRGRVAARGLAVDIQVDGGVKVDNVAEVVAAGADVIVSGTGIFEAPDLGAAIGQLRARAEAASQRASAPPPR